jgi:citrate synthase
MRRPTRPAPSPSMSRTYELKDLTTGKTALLNAVSGTIGPDVLDIGHLTKDLGVFTFDPGFVATASTESKITYIDGDAGVLLYRGYPVEQLAERSSFLEVANLLIYGKLPTRLELDEFRDSILQHSAVNDQLMQVFRGFQRDAHPMAMVSAVVASMAAFYHGRDGYQRPGTSGAVHAADHREAAHHRRRRAYGHTLGQADSFSRDGSLAYCENLLQLLFAAPPQVLCGRSRWRPRRSTCCSSCMRTTSRTPARPRSAWRGAPARIPYAAISAGISALWGPGARRRQRGGAGHAGRESGRSHRDR